MPNNFHQKDLKYDREGPESLYVDKERCCFDNNKLLRLMFEQLTNERYIAEAGVSSIGGN
jgi:hypothetical protein